MEKEQMHKIMFVTKEDISIPQGKSFTIDIDGKKVTITCLQEIFTETKSSISDLGKKRTPRDVVDNEINTEQVKPFTRSEMYENDNDDEFDEELKEAYLAVEQDRKELNKDWDRITGEGWD